MKILQKLNWRFRKTHVNISPLTIYINDNWEGWGFDILKINYGISNFSFLKITYSLPNGADKKLSFEGDFLFLRNYLLKVQDSLDDSKLWNGKLNRLDEFKLLLLKMIFKL